jgi:hypothetical protein
MRPILLALIVFSRAALAADIQFADDNQGTLHISADGRSLADYVYQDTQIPRPYFKSVHAPNGSQITRTQPPDSTKDIADHPLFHPGIWLSFGDLSGSDYWRLAAKTRFAGFDSKPQATATGGEFTVRFQYLNQLNPESITCEESFRCQIFQRPAGILIVWDSTFTSDNEFVFGDQEEMGLGIRMATPLRSERQARGEIAPGSGTILTADGRKNGAEVWGHSAPWCDYSGIIDGQQVGATLFCHPENFRPSWFHARDYGLLVANPFGRKAFKHGAASQVVIEPNDQLRLRYGIFLYSGDKTDINAAYQDYVDLTTAK